MSTIDPITPPPELVEKWHDAWIDAKVKHDGLIDFLATQAAQWGSDQELEACCEWLKAEGYPGTVIDLRDARRPKPPSRKEQALEAIGRLCASVIHDDLKNDAATIRRALEQLDD